MLDDDDVCTSGEELHGKRELALESINLETFFFKAGEELFKLLSLRLVMVMRSLQVSKGFEEHGVAVGLAVQA